VVNKFIEQMDLSALEAKYKGGGTSSYHPKMMLKVYIVVDPKNWTAPLGVG